MIPGAPPVRLVSVTEIFCSPLTSSETADPTALTCNCVPAGSAAVVTVEPSWVQLPELRLNNINCGLPLFQKYRPTYALCPLFCTRTAAPIHWPPVSCVEVVWIWENWSLPNDAAFQVSPVNPVAVVPATTCDEIVSAP